MVNDFRIKKYWIATLCTVLFSLASFSQGLVDTTIGFNRSKETDSLKKLGFKDKNLAKELAKLRKNKIADYMSMTNRQDAVIKENKAKLTSKSSTAPNTNTTKLMATAEMVCESNDLRYGTIYSPYAIYGDYSGIRLNTLANITFRKWTNATNGNLVYEWKLFDPNGVLLDTKNTLNFPITATSFGTYKVTLKLTDAIGCTEFEQNFTVRDPNVCIIPQDARGGAIYTPQNREQVPMNHESIITFSPYGFSPTNFIYKWDLLNLNGQSVATSTQTDFTINPSAEGQYVINLEITDPTGCTTIYKRDVEAVEFCMYNNDEYAVAISAPDEYTTGRVTDIKIGQTITLESFLWNGFPPDDFTYSWKLYNPNDVEIGSGSNTTFPVTTTIPGYYKVTLGATSKATGCVTSTRKIMNSLIENGCTVNNEKSLEVQSLYLSFVKKLIQRVVLGETDEQINSTIAMPEFMALKPYIKNSIGDRIYNFVSLKEGFGEDQRVNGINFSFSPDRAYDVHIYSFYGIYYNPEYNTPEDLDYSVSSAIFTNVSQYIAADDFFVSCQVINGGKKAKTGKVVLEPYECTKESEVRNIIFCPGEGSNCTPEIVGIIKSANTYIYPNQGNSFSFETTVPNLTYSWTITSEAGQAISTSNADITTPFAYTFANEGVYFIKLVAKNEIGCTTNFTKKVIVDNKRCASETNTFVFETEVANVNYTWTTTDISGNTVDTVTNTTGVYSFTTNIAGTYEVKLTANAEEKCETIFKKTIFIENCTPVVVVSCTQNNPLTPKIHRLFIDLVNKLSSAPNGVDANVYAKNEIAALIPYTYSPRAKIFNFTNDTSSISFSFTEDAIGNDVYLPKSNLGTITGIDLDKFEGHPYKTIVETHYSNGSYDDNGYVRNIDFCPSQECTPLVGTITIVKRNANVTKPVSTVLPTKTYQYEGIWLSNATQQPEVNAWVDYKDASGVLKRTLIGAITNGCKEITASSIVNTNGVDVCSNCQELHVESQNTELCYKVTYLDCLGQIKTLVTDATTAFPGKRIISAVQQGCNSTSPPPVETSKTTTSTSSRI